jgi:hypothetical protein
VLESGGEGRGRGREKRKEEINQSPFSSQNSSRRGSACRSRRRPCPPRRSKGRPFAPLRRKTAQRAQGHRQREARKKLSSSMIRRSEPSPRAPLLLPPWLHPGKKPFWGLLIRPRGRGRCALRLRMSKHERESEPARTCAAGKGRVFSLFRCSLRLIDSVFFFFGLNKLLLIFLH